MAATSLSTRTTLFGALAWACFDLADGGGTESSLSGLAAVGAFRSRQPSSADDSEQALTSESTAGSLLKMPSGIANSMSRTLCDAAVGAPNCGRRGTVGLIGCPFFGGLPGTIAATL